MNEQQKAYITTVASIIPFDVREEKPGMYPRSYHIAASDGSRPQTIHIDTGHHFVYVDSSRGSLKVPTTSLDIAKSVVNDFIQGQLRVRPECHPGIFFIPGYVTADDILEDKELSHTLKIVKSKQNLWFKAITQLADDDWQRYAKHTVISDFQRTAALHLGLSPASHPWMSPEQIIELPKCPACGAVHQPEIAVCGNCSCILNREKYNTLQFVPKG